MLRFQVRYLRTPTTQCLPASRRYASTVDKKKYSKTLRLPLTAFPLRNKNQSDVDRLHRQKTTIDLYTAQRRRDGPEFMLHDGPPYANGNLHMGHALNRTLKDIINRYKVITGHRVHYVPGWDCHGLPIEQKALEQAKTSHLSIDPIKVREIARKTALSAIDTQKKEMKEIGIMADWDGENGTYRTLSLDYEVRQMKLFAQLVQQGLISHRLRPVYYSPSSRTALAEAELKYDTIKARSVYVAFPISYMSPALQALVRERDVALAIWTTTPWTLPANMAVAISKELTYALIATQGRHLIVASARLEPLKQFLGEMEVLAEFSGADIIGTKYRHRFGQDLPVIASRHVTSESGTGLVHTAPAHGHDDYEAFMSNGTSTDLICPVDDAGLFTHISGAESLFGKSVLGDGVDEVLNLLQDSLLAQYDIEHRYPLDWKTKLPVIVRATPQWFADVAAIKPLVHQSLDKVEFHPPQSRTRLESFVQGRAEWCISRQRSWGVPIPALFLDGQPVIEPSVVDHIIQVLADNGTDYWWQASVDAFIPPHLKGAYTKGTDTLDVWFDSGSSWTLAGAADVYLEGSDQHRGWFQSSLLTYVGSHLEPKAPFRQLITHGFVLDEKGQKMSKSSGNGISPLDIIDKHGADVLRLWAASVDYTRDVSIGPSAITHAAESLRKVRSALRFMLANGADSGEHELSLIDQYILAEVSRVQNTAMESYDAFAFNKVINLVSGFLAQMSSIYFDAIKDNLYCGAGPSRAGTAYTLHQVLRTLLPVVAPILPHLAEEIWTEMGNSTSIFLAVWKADAVLAPVNIDPILQLRSQVLSLAAASGMRPSAIDVTVQESLPYEDRDIVQILGVSALRQSSEIDVLSITPARQAMCARCWRHAVHLEGHELCARCEKVVSMP